MLCDRCGREIEGEPEVVQVDSPTGAAPSLTLCPWGCRAAPHQSTPDQPPPRGPR
ncbi:Small CPxCG-related zinc finger protein OS=Streptomyces fumanus OX=67302 GN=GCM10018772_05460 PE=4 SV=1 [Streptomyces fumanus]|uniref:Uncharacterized protein n=1 Tax=Streptomyces fumanus TaxID=67302 RepID=A0A919A334_9ACTN|nr:hypothetical protein GCM10018772_05460 [Streptomyces fumanus]